MSGRLLVLLILVLPAWLGAADVPPLITPAGETHAAPVAPPGRAVDSRAPLTDPDGRDPSGVDLPGDASGSLIISMPGDGRTGASNAVKILILITLLAVAPGFLMMMTSFSRVIIVLGFTRRAMGTQTLPPNQVLLGLSLFLTLFIMAPTLKRLHADALQPYLAGETNEEQALAAAKNTVKNFMANHTRKRDLAMFVKIAGDERPRNLDDVEFTTLVPAFVTSELKTAFQMGFVIFLPFVVIDLVVAAILMSLGMMMLPPVMVSLPFKVLLFVLADGWVLLLQGLVASYA